MNKGHLQEIPLEKILPDPEQPRSLPAFDELKAKAEAGDRRANAIWEKLTELATSILEVGLEQPITVYESSNAGYYTIYDGHRRWLAMNLLHRQGEGEGTILCHVRDLNETKDDVLLGQININMQHDELNVFELARSMQKIYANLKQKGGNIRLVRDDGSIELREIEPGEADEVIWNIVEKKMGIGRSRRYQIQSVLKLSPRIQQIAERAGVSEGRLRLIIPLEDPLQETVIGEIAKSDLPTATIKQLIKDLKEDNVDKPKTPNPVQIKSAIQPIQKVIEQIKMVDNVYEDVSGRDPRTIDSYRAVLPELKTVIEDLQLMVSRLSFLQEG